MIRKINIRNEDNKHMHKTKTKRHFVESDSNWTDMFDEQQYGERTESESVTIDGSDDNGSLADIDSDSNGTHHDQNRHRNPLLPPNYRHAYVSSIHEFRFKMQSWLQQVKSDNDTLGNVSRLPQHTIVHIQTSSSNDNTNELESYETKTHSKCCNKNVWFAIGVVCIGVLLIFLALYGFGVL